MMDFNIKKMIAQEANNLFLDCYDDDCLTYEGYDGAYNRYLMAYNLVAKILINSLGLSSTLYLLEGVNDNE